ncbi:uncharacterized protein EV154DRAFT_483659 [Mucor mucedo]|uniref:uncharacterized protein n=1 Tax=Mucor mucedo TaxID=29922 RepID=UPI00221F8B9B|nr:uncharacterized protein EV154DRAFT_483659 [Mucor mucedo]KAI7888889.1 hypothetical protein EV154DRAFT_483659 [Mucor mucedo]
MYAGRSYAATNISLATLQNKLAFLLETTRFLRPSDLYGILWFSMVFSNNDLLLSFECIFEVVIIFPVCILLPLTAYFTHCTSISLQITTAASLLINLIQPDRPIMMRTIQAWMSRPLHESMKEKRVSVQSVASSLALQSGIPKEDRVTMGNWE